VAKFKQIRSIKDLMTSPEIESVLKGIGEQVLSSASSDPNQEYVASLDLHSFVSSGRSGSRIVVQVGAKPGLGLAVESQRGTLARALGSAS
jgi:hypothetical protein